MKTDKLAFLIIKALSYPVSFLPIRLIHFLGALLGNLAYYTLHKFRKRTLSNLSLAKDLCYSEKELIQTAKKSFKNLAITCLEYAKLSWVSKIESFVKCKNPKVAQEIIDKGKGVIFFCGHQANWELLFLEGTLRMPGVAIGRPIKNRYLYNWVVSIREKFGGTIIPPKSAIKEGFRALKRGRFFGILGDQGMPESEYAFDFFGRRAWTTPAPALLAYKTQCPIVVATILRKHFKYEIHYSDPIWPRKEAGLEDEVKRMMQESLDLLEEKIRLAPDQWLWQHNRWKQETPIHLYYRFRVDSILIVLPNIDTCFKHFLKHLHTFREIYPKAFLTLFIPKRFENQVNLKEAEVLTYKMFDDLLIRDYRFKLVFNFFGKTSEIKKHFLKLSAFEIYDSQSIKKLAKPHNLPGDDFSLLLKKALTRPNTLWSAHAR